MKTEPSWQYRVMASIFAAFTVEPLVFICFLAFFLDLVTLPQIILDNVCALKHNQTRCQVMSTGSFKGDYDVVQKESSLWFGAYLVTSTFITIFTLPTIGTLSDVLGRIKVMYLTPISLLIKNVIVLFILYSEIHFQTWVVILLAPIPAVAGDVSGFYVAVGAYIADITTVEQRTMRFNLLDAATLLGGFTATLISGLIIERFGYMAIYVANLGFLLIAILYLNFLVKPVNSLHINFQGNLENKERVNILEQEEHEGQNSLLVEKNHNVDTDTDMGGIHKETKNHLPESECMINSDNATGEPEEPNASMAKQNGDENFESNWMQENGKDGREDAGPGEEMEERTNRSPETESESLGGKRKINHKNMVDEDEVIPEERVEKLAPLTKVGIENDLETIAEFHDNENIKTSSEQINDLKKGLDETINLRDVLRHANPIRNFKWLVRCFKDSGNMNLGLILFLLMAFGTFSYVTEMTVLVNYLKNRPFFLDARNIGFLLAFNSGIISIVGLGFFSFLMTKVFKLSDYVMVVITFAAGMFYYVLLGLANSLLMLYLIQFVHAVCTLVTPTLRSMLSKLVPPSSVGVMMGALLMVETFAVLIGSLAGSVTYARLAASYPGAVFFVVAGIAFLATIISVGLLCKSRNIEYRHVVEDCTNNNACLTQNTGDTIDKDLGNPGF